MGDQAVVVFLNGPCGDVTQVNNLSPNANEFGERSARLVGGTVGAAAIKTLVTAEPGDLGPTAAASEVLRIPRRKPSPERVARCTELAKKDPAQCDRTEWTFAKEIVMLDALIAKEPVLDVEAQAIQVGPAVYLANPAEYFCQYGLDIKAGSPFAYTCPVELANGCVGYVPTEEALGPHGGGYETRLTAYSNLEVTAGTQIAEACVYLARALTPGAVPEPPKIDKPRGPWGYGSVAPELD